MEQSDMHGQSGGVPHREQPTSVATGRWRRRAVVAVALIATLAAVVVAVLWLRYERPYSPPPFEPDAVVGVPDVPGNMGYSEVDAMGQFAFRLCGVTYQQEDGTLRLFFTNPSENEAYLMCEVLDLNGKALYKSGLLRPGEYVERLSPMVDIENEAINIEIKVYALNMGNYTSVGTVSLDNVLQPY